MGLTRKMLSVGTMGAVDFRSDKERTAAYTKSAKREQRQQTAIMRQQLALQQQQYYQQQQHNAYGANDPQIAGASQPASAPPAGWFPDPAGQPRLLRYWDGRQWTNQTAAVQ